MVRPIRQAHGPEALEGQAHHPEQGRRTDGVSKGEKRQLSPLVEHGDSNPEFDITWLKNSPGRTHVRPGPGVLIGIPGSKAIIPKSGYLGLLA